MKGERFCRSKLLLAILYRGSRGRMENPGLRVSFSPPAMYDTAKNGPWRSRSAGRGLVALRRCRIHKMSFSSGWFKALAGALIGTLAFGSVAFGGDWLRYDRDISGRIVDFDTGQPIEGVVVSACWTIAGPALIAGRESA